MRDALLKNPLFQATSVARLLRAQPLSFIDVGARGGAHPLVESVAAATAVLGFEPDEAECARLKQTPEISGPWASFDLEPIALWNREGMAPLHLCAADTNHSLLPVSDAFIGRYGMGKFAPAGNTSFRATTLDKVLYGAHADRPHLGELIKIDTQGTEYEILEGAARTLEERCVAVVAEVWFCEVYKGVKQFSEVELLLRKHGFSFYGFASWHLRSRRQLDKRHEVGRERALYADAVFLKDPLPGGPKLVTLDARRGSILFLCALLFGYYDFALELALATWAKNDPAEAAAVSRLVHGLAAASPEATAHEVAALADAVRTRPNQAIILAGQFADRRRLHSDYDDIVLDRR
jgi:FkbM family methyltransferase